MDDEKDDKGLVEKTIDMASSVANAAKVCKGAGPEARSRASRRNNQRASLHPRGHRCGGDASSVDPD
jgi:hypothetical protein